MDFKAYLRKDSQVSGDNVFPGITLSEYDHFNYTNKPEYWEQISNFVKSKFSSFNKMVVIGIGGSCLGGKTLCHYYSPFNDRVDFWDSADQDFLEARWSKVSNPEKTLFLVVSKSGSTLETFAGRDFVLDKFKGLNLDFKSNFAVLTESKESKLFNWGEQNDLAFFEHPLEIGGRFSVLTSVGLIPFCFLLGSRFDSEIKKLGRWKAGDQINKVVEHYLESFKRDEYVSIFWPYEEKLRYVGDWIQQLWAESLGKKLDKDGNAAPKASNPLGLHGSKDQHSVLQQVVEGQKDKFLSFFKVMEITKSQTDLVEIMKDQTPVSLREKVNYIDLEFSDIWDVFASFQYIVIALGAAHNINPFDQPGVEDSKILFKKRIAELNI